ncbi:MAG: transcriptional regulator TbsP, partial [archaeon]
MVSNLLDKQLGEIVDETLSAAQGTVYLVNPTPDAIEAYVDVGNGNEYDVTVRLLAEYRTLKDVLDDFIVASSAADLVDRGELELKTVDDPPTNTVIATEDRIVSLIAVSGRVGGVVTDDRSFVDDVRSAYDELWETADDHRLRTPPITRVRETLSTDLGEETQEDFSGVLSSLETARGDGDGLDEVTISLLIAAKNEELLYDVSKWGEDIGLASKATFSRTKTKLEEMGLIDTEKVPVDVGRPRLRLKLGDSRLKEA